MSTKKFLYDELDTISKWARIEKNVPDSVMQNLNQKYKLRPYRVEAFKNSKSQFFHREISIIKLIRRGGFQTISNIQAPKFQKHIAENGMFEY